MLPFSATYNLTITRPHERSTRVRVFHGPTEVTPSGGVPIVDGTITASLSSRVTRTLELQVPTEFFPHNADDLLSPYRATLLVESGIRYLDGSSELFPLFKGRVYEASLAGDGAVTLRADDLAADVLAYRFERPFVVQPGYSVFDMIELLINDAIDSPTFGTYDVVDAITPTFLAWDEDRGQALDDLAAAVGARWYTLGDGSFVVRKYDYGDVTPLINLFDAEGDLAGGQGILISATKTITRDATANVIVVNSERTDGSTPIRVVRRDFASTSPTQFGGLFGKVCQVLRPQTPLTVAEADRMALRQLTASLALTEQWDLTTPTIHPLEPGDAVRIRYRGVEAVQVIDSMRIPLTTQGSMSIRTRSSVPEPTTE